MIKENHFEIGEDLVAPFDIFSDTGFDEINRHGGGYGGDLLAEPKGLGW